MDSDIHHHDDNAMDYCDCNDDVTLIYSNNHIEQNVNGTDAVSGDKKLSLGVNSTSSDMLSAVRCKSDQSTSLVSTFIVLCMQLCDHVAFVTIAANLIIFCTDNLKLDMALSSTISLVFTGFSLFFTLVCGWIADSLIGRYNTILACGLFYIFGLVTLCSTALPYSRYFNINYAMNNTVLWVLFAIALATISIGAGGIEANVSPFGADQLTQRHPETIRTFLACFFWLLNIGAVLARTLIIYVETNVSFFYGFLVPLAMMSFTLVTFVSRRSRLIIHPPNGSVLTNLCKIGFLAVKRRWKQRNASINLLDHARSRFGGFYPDNDVNTLMTVMRTLPVFACVILYYTIYFQMQSSYVIQGLAMDLNLGSFEVPPASLSVFDTISCLILVPFTDRVLYPILTKLKCNVTVLRRMGVGMLFATLSVLYAGLLENYRRRHVDFTIQNEFSGTIYNASTASVFLQVPQYAFMGFSEVFTMVGGFEFTSTQSPLSLQSVMMGLFFVNAGLGSFLGSGLVNLVKYISQSYSPCNNWYPDDVNNGKLDYFFYLLSGLMLANFGVFCFVTRHYKYRDDTSHADGDNIGPEENDTQEEHIQKREEL